jgi:hypothetical protein
MPEIVGISFSVMPSNHFSIISCDTEWVSDVYLQEIKVKTALIFYAE